MTLFHLAWRNLVHKPWSTALSIILAALGAGLISLLLLVNHQLEGQFERNLAGVDLVIGAKGSPLQLILSSMYHVDAPTGNIAIAESKPFLNPRHPYIEQAVPLSLGDSYRAYRIVGTRPEFLEFYELTIGEGRIWQAPMEVVTGAAAADKLDLELGTTFQSSHGLEEDEDLVHGDAQAFRVVGILEPSGTVADQLLLTPNESMWVVHEHEAVYEEEETEEEPAEADPESSDTTHAGHNHEAEPEFDVNGPLLAYEDRDITSILVRFKGTNIQTLNMQRGINENTNLQAATPAMEINRIYAALGQGERALRGLALVIAVVSILSIFISLYANLDERRYELALMRTMGASRGRIFALLMLEGVVLAVLGCLIGLVLSHLGMAIVAQLLEEGYRYTFDAWLLLPAEGLLLVVAVLVGLAAALLPALRASRTDIHETLAEA